MINKFDKQLRLSSYALYESEMINILSTFSDSDNYFFMENQCGIAKMKWSELNYYYGVHRRCAGRTMGTMKFIVLGYERYKAVCEAYQDLLFSRLFKMKLSQNKIKFN